jgi:ferrous iron transport protein A
MCVYFYCWNAPEQGMERNDTMQSIATKLTLAELKTGEHAALVTIRAGRGVTSRLTSLGFTPGVDIEMTHNYGRGPIVVTVRGARVALGRHEASHTIVLRATA